MGIVIEVNQHLDIEVRRASFMIHDDELPGESPEFGFERVFALKSAIDTVIAHERFQRWLAKREGR